MLKRFITSLFCLFLIFVSIPITCYTHSFCVPVYASDETLDNWRNATTNEEFAEAFRYYCKSRDLTINGTVPNVLTNGTTNIFNALCNGIGINLTALQGHIKYEVDSSGNKGVKWLLDSQGITFYNRLFAQFLQDNDLEVGDTVEDKIIMSGKYYTDLDGSSCFVTILSRIPTTSSSQITSLGTSYKGISNASVPSYVGNSIVCHNRLYDGSDGTYTIAVDSTSDNNGIYYRCNRTNLCNDFTTSDNFITIATTDNERGYIGMIYQEGSNKGFAYIGSTRYNDFSQNYVIDLRDLPTENISITTNNLTINNNTYEGDTIINGDGDNEPSPGGKDPGWDVGGGQGSYQDNSGNSYTINFPDFELPDLNIDWSIQGLGNKFPFSIPFDIASLVAVLNAEPEAPRFQGTLDLGITSYAYDINLAQFDSVASACRIAELLLLVFGLIMITRSIIKG